MTITIIIITSAITLGSLRSGTQSACGLAQVQACTGNT